MGLVKPLELPKVVGGAIDQHGQVALVETGKLEDVLPAPA
jgi:hypothetical protein